LLKQKINSELTAKYFTVGEVMLFSSLSQVTKEVLLMSTLDTRQCPLCQQNNLCAVDASTPCWCVSSEIKPELLTQVPAALAGKSCICKKCIDKFNLKKVIDKS
jgi:hypothetical protein